MSNREAAAASERMSKRDVLELIRDCSSQEWQDASGKLFGATDNQGRRLWLISEDVMREVRAVLASAPQAVREPLTEAAVLRAARCAGVDEETWLRIKAYLPVGIVPLAPQDTPKEGGK
jgi:hypothetical protein